MPTTQKIRYSDCDPQGIVFNGNFPRYWDDAFTDWLEEAGYGGPELGGIGAEVVTARLEMDFKASATLGDVLITEIQIERIGNTSMTLAFTTRRQADQVVVVAGREIVVFVDPHEFKPTAMPAKLKSDLGGESG